MRYWYILVASFVVIQANASPNNISIGRRSVAPSKSRNANRYTASPGPREAKITPIPINPRVKRSLGRRVADDCSVPKFRENAIVSPIRYEIDRSFRVSSDKHGCCHEQD